MSDWLEVKQVENGSAINKAAVRVFNISALKSTGAESCRIYTTEDFDDWFNVAESYDSIMARIRELEECPAPVIERFTEEEYKILLGFCKKEIKDGMPLDLAMKYKKIIKTIKAILEEE